MTAGRSISPRQASAVRIYARDFEGQDLTGHPLKVLAAKDGLKAARAALALQEVAVLDLIAGRGRKVADVAQAAGRTPDAIAELFLAATDKLADHYESRPADPT